MLEVANVLRTRLRSGSLVLQEMADGVDELLGLLDITVPAVELVEGVIRHAQLLTPYDAAYLAVAEELGAPLITLDGTMFDVAKSSGIMTYRPGTAAFARWLEPDGGRL